MAKHIHQNIHHYLKKKDEICHWSKKSIAGKVLTSISVMEVEDFFINTCWKNPFDKIIVPVTHTCHEKYKTCKHIYCNSNSDYGYDSY